MALLPYQSPLSILGLKYNNYSSEDLVKAIRRAKLHCHTDKAHLRNSPIPPDYIHLVDAAGEYLLKGRPTVEFKGYPVLYFPHLKVGSSGVYWIPSDSNSFSVCSCGERRGELSDSCKTPGCDGSKHQKFNVCEACKTAIPSNKYKDHIFHHQDFCYFCKEAYGKENHVEHIKSHTLESCTGCENPDIYQLNRHINEHIDCPLCGQKCGYNFPAHLDNIHYFKEERDCVDCPHVEWESEFSLHVQNEHAWTICPCNISIAQGRFLDHFKKEHAFKRCMSCPRTEAGLAEDHEHIKAHLPGACCDCGQIFPGWEMPLHLSDSHEWLLCEYCKHVVRTTEMLIEHEELEHRLLNCSECDKRLLLEEHNGHLRNVHGWKLCPWCSKLSSSDKDLYYHMDRFHPQTLECSICHHTDVFAGLQKHMRDVHGWKICLCDLHAHIGQSHLQTLKCSFCSYTDTSDKLQQHMRDVHGWKICLCHQEGLENRLEERPQCKICAEKAPKARDITSSSGVDFLGEDGQESHSDNQQHLAQNTPHITSKPQHQDLQGVKRGRDNETQDHIAPGPKRKKYKTRKTRCHWCKTDKQKCILVQPGGNSCERCMSMEYNCEPYAEGLQKSRVKKK